MNNKLNQNIKQIYHIAKGIYFISQDYEEEYGLLLSRMKICLSILGKIEKLLKLLKYLFYLVKTEIVISTKKFKKFVILYFVNFILILWLQNQTILKIKMVNFRIPKYQEWDLDYQIQIEHIRYTNAKEQYKKQNILQKQEDKKQDKQPMQLQQMKDINNKKPYKEEDRDQVKEIKRIVKENGERMITRRQIQILLDQAMKKIKINKIHTRNETYTNKYGSPQILKNDQIRQICVQSHVIKLIEMFYTKNLQRKMLYKIGIDQVKFVQDEEFKQIYFKQQNFKKQQVKINMQCLQIYPMIIIQQIKTNELEMIGCYKKESYKYLGIWLNKRESAIKHCKKYMQSSQN
ncbi:unnamed protein product [Paramecium sonneborni]|uniref:Transmembrane protein n=1 Tax=Paramecium sonneborni TaxID=65129 RepID=A0A8S1MT31_9CILI|nr:unnamed protein product [Paramecium sonneborni]